MLKPHHRHCLVAFLVDCAVLVSFAAMPFFVYQKLHGGALMSGMVAASQAATYGVVSLLSAAFVNRMRNGLVMAAAGIVLFGLGYNLAPLAQSPLWYAIIASAGFAGLGLVWPALHSWLGGEHDLVIRKRRIVAFNISWSLGLAVGPLFGGPLFDWHYFYPFVFSMALCLAAMVLTLTLPHERKYFAPAAGPADAARLAHDHASEEHLYYAWMANWLGQGLMNVVRSILPKRVENLVQSGDLTFLWHGTGSLSAGAATQYSWIAFSASVASAGMFFALGFTHRWQHRFGFLVVLQLAAGAAMYVLGTATSLVAMALCAAVIGANTGACFFTAVYYSLANPTLKHGRTAINEAAVGLGSCAGSLTFGYLASHAGVGPALLYGPAIVVVVLIVEGMVFVARRVSLPRRFEGSAQV